MTTRYLLLFFIFASVATHAQNRRFLEKVDATEPVFYTESEPVSEQRLDLKNFDVSHNAGLFIGTINSERERRFRIILEQDSLLNQIALAGIDSYNKKRYIHSKTWRQESKSIKFALQYHHSKNKIYSAHAFTVDLLDLEFTQGYYCDKRNDESDLHLYKGKRPKITDPEDENYVEPIPLFAITEKQMGERILNILSKGTLGRDLLSKKYSRVGVAVKVDKHSLHANIRPELFVILIFGGKQLQDIKVPKDVADGSFDNVEEE